MKAVILAAGKGSRLRPAGLDLPKCLLDVGGRRIIDRQLAALHAHHVRDILLVVGYRNDLIRAHLGNRVRYRVHPDWDTSNNFLTLWNIRDELTEGFACLFADVLCDEGAVGDVLASHADIALLVDTSRVLAGTMRIRIVDGSLRGIGSQITVDDGSGNFVGIAKFSAVGARRLLDQMGVMVDTSRHDYYTVAIDRLANGGESIECVDLAGRAWVEVDTAKDLERAVAAHVSVDAR